VTATVRKNSTGQEVTVRAGYLVAVDGADSGVRQALRVRVSGPGILNRQIGIYFEAPTKRARGVAIGSGGHRPAG
jgi:putative polyketide hydroxylase